MASLTVHNIDPETLKRLEERAARNGRTMHSELRRILRKAVGTQENVAAVDTQPVIVRLERTCFACPEQYDAFIGEEKVGYLRLRHGHFMVECPDVFGETVYEASPNGDGIFDDDERDEHLEAAREAIAERWRERAVNPRGRGGEGS
jgi:plasmid stability protein